jgi:peptidoglycan hydrolase-like protein with peptidoglycan-binding domain
VVEFSPASSVDVAAVVTKLPTSVGQTVNTGSVLVEVSDRPVIYLTGQIPLLRDLRLGDRGSDVRRLQESLSAWGAPPADGEFGAGTARALRALYEAAGYAARTDLVALRSEFVFGPSDSALVIGVGSRLGAPVASPLIRVTTSAPVVSAEVAEPVAQQLALGQPVAVTGTDIGGAFEGKVSNINGLVKSEDGAYRIPIEVAVEGSLLPEAVDSPISE